MKILYFYPENPLLLNQGNNVRANILLHYFKQRQFEVDYVGQRSDLLTDDSIDELKNRGLISKGFLINDLNRKKNQLTYFFRISLYNKFFGKIKEFDRNRIIQKKQFNTILEKNKYDYIIISYAYWSSLIEGNLNLGNAKLIVDTHDFLTAQFQTVKRFSLGNFFENEIRNLSFFDKILVISNEEKYIFSQFIKKPIHIVTHALEKKMQLAEKKYDLIYVASENEHNVNSAKWFFESVYPILDKGIKMCVIGKITKHIDEYPNVEKVSFAESLDEYYAKSKIAICPMLSGTGLKIKVIEALSFGLPVVCNERGIDGLLNKTNNGCIVTNDATDFARNIKKLLGDTSFYNEISSDSKTFFGQNHDINSVYKSFDKVFSL